MFREFYLHIKIKIGLFRGVFHSNQMCQQISYMRINMW